MVLSLALLVILAAMLMKGDQPLPPAGTDVAADDKTTPIMLYCAASNKSVVEVIRQDYQRETGRQVQIQYGPSQTLLASAAVSSRP